MFLVMNFQILFYKYVGDVEAHNFSSQTNLKKVAVCIWHAIQWHDVACPNFVKLIS
jgi:hypothetical protein